MGNTLIRVHAVSDLQKYHTSVHLIDNHTSDMFLLIKINSSVEVSDVCTTRV